MMAFRTDPALRLSHVIRSQDAYFAPKADRWVLGATSEDRGFDRRVTAGGLYQLLDAAQEIVPAILELEVLDTWAGFRPASRDNGPILGGCDTNGLWFCTGHYRNGIQQAPISIEAVSNTILGRPTVAEATPFSLARFKR
jgi:glycine oxidase